MIQPDWAALLRVAAPTATPDAIAGRAGMLAVRANEFGLRTPARIAGFLSNTAHETGDFHRSRENLNYTTAAAIRRTWPSRFKTDDDAGPFVRNPEALANKVYARPAEGNTQPGDGWRYRGGGDFQITFRNGFAAAARDTGLALVDHPDLIEGPGAATLTALAYFRRAGLAAYYDRGEAARARALVNAGNPDFPNPIGLADVLARHARIMGAMA